MEKTHNDKGFSKLCNPFLIYGDNITMASTDIWETYVEDIIHPPPHPLVGSSSPMPPFCYLCPPGGLTSQTRAHKSHHQSSQIPGLVLRADRGVTKNNISPMTHLYLSPPPLVLTAEAKNTAGTEVQGLWVSALNAPGSLVPPREWWPTGPGN